MKKITLNLVKGLLVIVLFTGVSVVLSVAGVQTVTEAKAGGCGEGFGVGIGLPCPVGVPAAAINQYLISNGYTVEGLSQISGSSNWKAYTVGADGRHYITTVYVQGSQILGNADGAL